MAEIRVEQLHKAFAGFTAVKGSTFTVKDGEFFCLLGPSGCGKTTTLRMIAGLELPTRGQIFLGGEDVTWKRASQRDIAFVFQLFALYPHLNVRRNIAFSVADDVPVGELLMAVRGRVPPCVREVEVFDQYRGKGVEPGQKSLALRIVMQDTDRTLTDSEVEAVVASIREQLDEQFQAKPRT